MKTVVRYLVEKMMGVMTMVASCLVLMSMVSMTKALTKKALKMSECCCLALMKESTSWASGLEYWLGNV